MRLVTLSCGEKSRQLTIFRSQTFVSGKGIEVELKLPFVPKPNDEHHKEDLGEDASEEPDQSEEVDQVESLQEELGAMSFKPKKRMEKGRDSSHFE